MEPKDIVLHMLENDSFSKWMGVELVSIEPGHCQLRCEVKEEMLNGHRIAHGGITYSLSDSALAFAANTYGKKCVSIETSISHLLTVQENDILHVKCEEVYRGKTVGIYSVSIFNQNQKLVSAFKGTVHISEKEWE